MRKTAIQRPWTSISRGSSKAPLTARVYLKGTRRVGLDVHEGGTQMRTLWGASRTRSKHTLPEPVRFTPKGTNLKGEQPNMVNHKRTVITKLFISLGNRGHDIHGNHTQRSPSKLRRFTQKSCCDESTQSTMVWCGGSRARAPVVSRQTPGYLLLDRDASLSHEQPLSSPNNFT